MRTISRAAFAVSLLLFSSSPFAECGAQDIAEITAYFALNSTPSAALAPVVTRTMLGEARSGADFIFRYGRADLVLVEADNLALTWVNGGARGSFGFTAGYWKPDCDDCDGHFVAGLHQMERHRAAHHTQTYEPEFHSSVT